jgi:ABC-type Fe3+-hydroxamate transport system substrate-binding protein
MYFKNTNMEEMLDALTIVNKKYENNIDFNRLEQRGKQIIATLRVKNANKKNGTTKGRKLNQQYIRNGWQKGVFAANGSACWHVHGDFFEAILELNPDVVIKTANKTIDINGGNWEDWNKGSIMEPISYSNLCECIT